MLTMITEGLNGRLMAGVLSGLVLGVAAPGQAAQSVGATPTSARTIDGAFISWVEHRIDDEGINGGVAIRGGDGLEIADIDRDGHPDIVSVHEDSHHLRIAFGTADPDRWDHITVARGSRVGAIEDVALGDLNGDGWLDLVAACEEAHLAYFQNPGAQARTAEWSWLIPERTTGRGSWLQVAIADLTGDGAVEVIAANKGFADVVRLPDGQQVDNATSMFRIQGDPLTSTAWQEQELMRDGIPNQAIVADANGDGRADVLAASRLDNRMMLLLNQGADREGEVQIDNLPILLAPAFSVAADWRGAANAFNAEFADLNRDGRPDLLVNILEFEGNDPQWQQAGLAWLEQPELLHSPWLVHRIGTLLPDWVIGIGVGDIDGDGDLDAIAGGYSGLNVVQGGYSGASRDADDAAVTASSSVARIAWFQNPGDPAADWLRHDISRRVRGMYDAFLVRDMDGDGDMDLVATRGNSGEFDGVFWLEQRRSAQPLPAFVAARNNDSRGLPLPPDDWRAHYAAQVDYIAPNKAAQKAALEE